MPETIKAWCACNRPRLVHIANVTKLWTLFLCLVSSGFLGGMAYEKFESSRRIDELIALVNERLPPAVSKLDETAQQMSETAGAVQEAVQTAKAAATTATTAARTAGQAGSAAKAASANAGKAAAVAKDAAGDLDRALNPPPAPPKDAPDWLNTP